MMKILLKRIYEEAQESDGYRVLADRLWPRGVSKEKADLDLWAKEIAPSTELRKWYHAHEDKYAEFEKKYREELENNPDSPAFIEELKPHRLVTLLTAVKDVAKSELPTLQGYIEDNLK